MTKSNNTANTTATTVNSELFSEALAKYTNGLGADLTMFNESGVTFDLLNEEILILIKAEKTHTPFIGSDIMHSFKNALVQEHIKSLA